METGTVPGVLISSSFFPQIICLAGIFYSKTFLADFSASVHALLFAGFPLEAKFRTPAGFAKNKLVQTFGFHLNTFYPHLSLGTGILPRTANIWGKWKLCRGCSCTSHLSHGWGQSSGMPDEPKVFQSGTRSLARGQLLNQDGEVKETTWDGGRCLRWKWMNFKIPSNPNLSGIP